MNIWLVIGVLLVQNLLVQGFGDAEEEGISPCGNGIIEEGGTCVDCPVGTYESDDTTCSPCPQGSYSALIQSVTCTLCPTGTFTAATGSTSESDCLGACTLKDPINASYNGAYSISTTGEATVLEGYSITLVCDQHFTIGGSSTKVETCDALGGDILYECYGVTIKSGGDTYHELSTTNITIGCSTPGKPAYLESTVLVAKNKTENVLIKEGNVIDEPVYKEFHVSMKDPSNGGTWEFYCSVVILEGYTEVSNETVQVTFTSLMTIIPAARFHTAQVGYYHEMEVVVKTGSIYRPSLSTIWLKDGVLYDKLSVTDEHTDNTLEHTSIARFQRLSFTDEGNYTANVTVGGFTQILWTQLSVRGFWTHPADNGAVVITKAEETVTLICSHKNIDHDSSEILRWVYLSPDGVTWVPLDPDSLEDITIETTWVYNTTADINMTTLAMTSQNVSAHNVSCAVFENENYGDLNHPINVANSVMILTHDYTITVDETAVTANEEVDAVLRCTADSPTTLEHPPTVHWYRVLGDGTWQLIEQASDRYISNSYLEGSSVNAQLTVLSVTEEDEGEYSCRAVYTVPGYIEITPDDTITLSIKQDDVIICTGLDPTWNEIKTDTSFPVVHGTVVTVTCEPGYELLLEGANIVICNEGTTFTYQNQPKCLKIGTIESQLLDPDKSHTSLVQLTVRNESGILCDDGWGDSEASVICQEHGYKRGKASKVKTDRVDYVATQLSCPCSNQALESCSYLNHTTADLQCREGGAAGVVCYNESFEYRTKLVKQKQTTKSVKFTFYITGLRFGSALNHKDMQSLQLETSKIQVFIGSEPKDVSIKMKVKKSFIRLQLILEGSEDFGTNCLHLKYDGKFPFTPEEFCPSFFN